MPDLTFELAAIAAGHGPICGIDEAGRGPLLGDVAAAAVVLPDNAPQSLLSLLNDSKKMTKNARARAEAGILAHAAVGIGVASVAEIDRLNILQATLLAMRRAVAALPVQPRLALIDGNVKPGLVGIVERTVIKGDAISSSIAAASIIAKEHRDRMLLQLATIYPQYGLERNAGYGTAEHLAALAQHGPCPAHRLSFAPVKRALAERAI